MYITKYYLHHKLPSGQDLLVNTLTGSIDKIDSSYLEAIEDIKCGNYSEVPIGIIKELKEGGYLLYSRDEENLLINEAKKQVEIARKNMPMTYFHYITYDCNLRCTYCCYRYLDRKTPVMENEYVDGIFKVMGEIQERENRPVSRIVLSGGEPFMEENRTTVEYFFTKAVSYKESEEEKNRKCILSVFTNGVEIPNFKDLLIKYKEKIGMIFVTLNGPKEIHDIHRITKNGEGSFDAVIKGINTLLEIGIKTWVVANVSKKNIDNLPDMYGLIKKEGWLSNENFGGCYVSRVKDHRNYNPDVLDESEMMKKIVEMIKNKEIYTHAFNFGDMRILKSVMSFAKAVDKKRETGSLMPYHQFNGCNNRSSQYSFAVDGNIYCCAPAMGRQEYSIGKFVSDFVYNEEKEKWWTERSVLNIPKCKECKAAFLCGGGCAYEALEKNNSADEPICTQAEDVLRAYLDSMETGIGLTHKDVLYD